MPKTLDPRSLILFVTGATSGFGAAIARRFVAAGARVVITGRRRDRLEALAGELGEAAFATPLDVRDEAEVKRVAAALPDEFASVNLLVNNAGLALGLGPAQRADMSDWEQMIDTNIKGLLYCTRALLPGMVERNEGHVINIGSVAGSYPYPGGNVYGGTKAFVMQFSLNLKADLLGTNVRVTCIEPGMAETEFSEVRFKGDREKASAVYKGLDAMSAEDIADTVFWAATLPRRVNINRIEMMPTIQAFSPFALHRT